MRLRRSKTPSPQANPAPTADLLRIAVLEHDLFGIQPQPGTAAALCIGLRRTGTCLQHDPIDVTTLDTPAQQALCSRCGTAMVDDGKGGWLIP